MTTMNDIRAIYPRLTEQNTGGDCTALLHPCDDGGHLLLSVDEGRAPGDSDTLIDCGVYDAESNLVGDIVSIHIDELGAWVESALAQRRGIGMGALQAEPIRE
jgi:hypothetical protein